MNYTKITLLSLVLIFSVAMARRHRHVARGFGLPDVQATDVSISCSRGPDAATSTPYKVQCKVSAVLTHPEFFELTGELAAVEVWRPWSESSNDEKDEFVAAGARKPGEANPDQLGVTSHALFSTTLVPLFKMPIGYVSSYPSSLAKVKASKFSAEYELNVRELKCERLSLGSFQKTVCFSFGSKQ